MRPRKPGRASALTGFFSILFDFIFCSFGRSLRSSCRKPHRCPVQKKGDKIKPKKKRKPLVKPSKTRWDPTKFRVKLELKKKENGLQIETRRLENWKNLFADRPLICLLLLARLVETHCTYPRCVLNYLFMSAKPVPVCRNEIRFNEIKLRIPLERTSRVTNERVQHCVFLCLISVRLIEIR